MTRRRIKSILMWALIGSISVASGQTPIRSIGDGNEHQVTNPFAQARPQNRAEFSLMASFNLTPLAAGSNLQVLGGGTLGRLTKWTGFTSSNSFIGDSTIFEDKNGLVGIGTDSPTSKLTVNGLIQSLGGGFKFPDGSVQTTAGVAANDVVRSLNGLKGDVQLAAGANIAVTQGGNVITVAAPNVLTTVAHDATLKGEGTALSPLSVVQSEATIEPTGANLTFSIPAGSTNVSATIYTVPAGKRLVIEHVSATCIAPATQVTAQFEITAKPTATAVAVGLRLVPVHIGNLSVGSLSTASTPMKLYGHSGTTIEVTATRDGTSGEASCVFNFSGFLVNLPQP
jgi:hypothetical protein